MPSNPPPKVPARKGGKRALAARILRAIALLLILGVLLVVCLGVAIRLLITPETVKAKIITQLQETFKRPVKIDHVSFVLHQGLKISGLEVRDLEKFGGGVFVSSEYLLARYKLSALLDRRLVLSEVRLVRPYIRVVRRADGDSNIGDILRVEEVKTESKGAFALPPLQSAGSIEIENGQLDLQDDLRGARFHIRKFRFFAQDLNSVRPFPVQLSLSTENMLKERKVVTDLEVVGEVFLARFVPENMYLDAKKIRLNVDGKKIEVAGMFRDMANPALKLSIRMPPLTSALLSQYHEVPPGIDFPPSRWDLKIRLPYLAAAVSSDTAHAPVSTAPVVSSWLPSSYDIEKLEVTAWPVRLLVSGKIGPGGGSSWLRWTIPRIELKKASALYKDLEWRNLDGTVEGSVLVTGPLRTLKTKSFLVKLRDFSVNYRTDKRLNGSAITLEKDSEGVCVEVSQGQWIAYSNVLSELDIDFCIAGTDLVFKKLNATWNESRVRLKGCVKNYQKKEKIFFDGAMNNFKVDETYKAVENLIILLKREKGEEVVPGTDWAHRFRMGIPPKFPDMAGQIVFQNARSPNFDAQNFQLNFDLKGISQGLNEVSGIYKIGFGPGRVRNVPDVRKANGLLNVLLYPFSFMHEMFQKARLSMDNVTLLTLDITRTYGDFAVKNGKVDVRYIHFDSPQFAGYANGTADFSTEAVDMDVIMRSMSSGSQLPDRMQDTRGRPSLRIKVKDNLNEPTAEINLNKIHFDDLESALSEGLKRGTALDKMDDQLTCGRKL